MSKSLPIWADSHECRGGDCCVTCRAQTPQGERFRAQMAKVFAMPPQWPACPVGIEWDAKEGRSAPMPTHEHGDLGGCGCSPPPKSE